MIHAFIFDMDGVLVNSEEMYYNRRMAYFKKNDLIPDSTNLNDFLGASRKKIWEILINDPIKREQVYKEYEKYEQNTSIDFSSYLNPNVPEFLQLLKQKNLKVVLASAGAMSNIEQMLTTCQIKQYFDLIVSGEEVAHNKPAPDIYLQVLKKTALSATEAIVVEDSTIGIAAGKASGIITWALKPKNYDIDQTKADRIFESFGEMINEVKSHPQEYQG